MSFFDTTERVRKAIAEVDAEEAAAAAKLERDGPPPHAEDQWAQAAGPEQPLQRTRTDWKPIPGIEAMQRLYPHSQPLTREQPPAPRTKVTLQQAKAIRITMFGRRLFLSPEQKRLFAELYEITDHPQRPAAEVPTEPTLKRRTFFT
jgi:hypothetical protein